ncbi:MAG: DUF2723 domain-containing protein [Acidobacteriota bacterium]
MTSQNSETHSPEDDLEPDSPADPEAEGSAATSVDAADVPSPAEGPDPPGPPSQADDSDPAESSAVVDDPAVQEASPRGRLWPLSRADRLPAALGGVLSLAVYVFTLAPSVTFKDSGELIIAALHFGVPHPTGYPLWTFLAGLFALLPLGPGAWEVNLFSAVCASASAATVAALAHAMARRFGDVPRAAAVTMSVAVSLVFAFSVSVWSQAVFAEVYTLHILVAALFWWALYRWYLEPENPRHFLLTIFLLALGMTNHHLMLALAPLPFLVALMRRRDLAWELIGYAIATGALFYLGFASLSDSDIAWETAVRTGQLAALLLVALVLIRRRLVHWRLGLLVVPTVALGLLPYAYMPISSATNPPMNWGYTQTADGFYYSVNRSPYRGPLSEQLMGTLGRIVGTAETEAGRVDLPPAREPAPTSATSLLAGFTKRYISESSRSFTFLAWPLVLFAGLALWRRREERDWWLVLGVGFGLSVLFQPASAAFAGAAARLEWFLQMPYLGYTYVPLALLLVYGLLTVYAALAPRSRLIGQGLTAAAALLPLVGLWGNFSECSQRDRWFGWQYGHDMLADLPEGAVVFGGGDAGRFIPTYMIFGESFEAPKHKRDPEFDRRDLYIITQTQLLVRFYRDYIRDHYGEDRPEPGWLGQLLGRESMYPDKSLVLPTEDDVALMIQQINASDRSISVLKEDIAEWIYLRNRESHTFFVEDARAMAWTVPLAIPAGPLYRLADGPRLDITDAEVEADFDYWRERSPELLAEPAWRHDLDARMAFTALRQMTGKVYERRGLIADAEAAYRQALELMPDDAVSLFSLGRLLVSQHRYGEAREVIAPYLGLTPVFTAAESTWSARQSALDASSALFTQLMLAPHDSRVIGRVLQASVELSDAEDADRRVFNIAEDLKLFQDEPENTVAVRRLLGGFRSFELHALANHLSNRRMTESPSRRLLQLVVADQSIQPVRLDEAGVGVRLRLVEQLLEVGEANLALNFLRGLERSDDILTLRASAQRLLDTQRALDPILDRWQQSGSAIRTETSPDDSSLAARLERLGVSMVAYQGSPTPETLRRLATSAWRLRLPDRVRRLLIEAQTADDAVLSEAVRLAAFDVLPSSLLPLAEAMEQRAPLDESALLNLAALRHAANDQTGMQRTIQALKATVGKEAMLRSFASSPILQGLVFDDRFHAYLRQLEKAERGDVEDPSTESAAATPSGAGGESGPGAAGTAGAGA